MTISDFVHQMEELFGEEAVRWSGFLQTTPTGCHPGKSPVLFLPIIDLNPSDLTCIYSTHDFVATQAKIFLVSPIVIFDQQLYWKAVQMVLNEAVNSTLKATVKRCSTHEIGSRQLKRTPTDWASANERTRFNERQTIYTQLQLSAQAETTSENEIYLKIDNESIEALNNGSDDPTYCNEHGTWSKIPIGQLVKYVDEKSLEAFIAEFESHKCEQYWPNPGTTQMFGDIKVESRSEDEYAEFTRRTFTLTMGTEERTLCHLQFTCWPDKAIPDDVTELIEFRQRVQSTPSTLNGPTVVHCRFV
ncbi:PTP10-like protein, partial [Mya arenaria]